MIKYIVAVLAIVASYTGTFYLGVSHGVIETQNGMLKKNTEQLEDLISNVQTVDTKLNNNAMVQEEIKAKLSLRQNEVTKEVIKYAQRPDANDVVLDDDWVRVYNDSNASAGTGDTSSSQVQGQTGRASSDASKPLKIEVSGSSKGQQ
ncbi:hypothetical protein ECO319P1_00085 [Escherichia phage ECO319P1]|nr:hypothetical protein ECO319P1_00085 [Escherichia phage ECO319P1]